MARSSFIFLFHRDWFDWTKFDTRVQQDGMGLDRRNFRGFPAYNLGKAKRLTMLMMSWAVSMAQARHQLTGLDRQPIFMVVCAVRKLK